MKNKRNPLGFMGTGGLFKRGGWWYIQYRDPQTKRNIQIKVSREKLDATVALTLTMIRIYESRLKPLRKFIEKARPQGLVPTDRMYIGGEFYDGYCFENFGPLKEYKARVARQKREGGIDPNGPDKTPASRRSGQGAGNQPADTRPLASGRRWAAVGSRGRRGAVRRAKTDGMGHVTRGGTT